MNKMEVKYPATLPGILQKSTDKFELSSDVEMPKKNVKPPKKTSSKN